MNWPAPVLSHTNGRYILGQKRDTPTPTIIETCILITGPDAKSQGEQFLAKRKFILDLKANEPTNSTHWSSASISGVPTPEPPPGTKSYYQRKHEINLTTLINQGTPLTAVSFLANQTVTLGIQKDIQTLLVGRLYIINIFLSKKVRGFQATIKYLNGRVKHSEESVTTLLHKVRHLKRTIADGVEANSTIATSFAECQSIVEARNAQVAELTSENVIFGKQLEDARMWIGVFNMAEESLSEITLQRTEDERRKRYEIRQWDLERQARERTVETLRTQIRQQEATINQMKRQDLGHRIEIFRLRMENKSMLSPRQAWELFVTIQFWIGILLCFW